MPLRSLQCVNLGTDFKRRPQFDVHGTNEMVLGQQQQGLPIDLLGAELLGQLCTPCEEVGFNVELVRLASRSPNQRYKKINQTLSPVSFLLFNIATWYGVDVGAHLLHGPLRGVGLSRRETVRFERFPPPPPPPLLTLMLLFPLTLRLTTQSGRHGTRGLILIILLPIQPGWQLRPQTHR